MQYGKKIQPTSFTTNVIDPTITLFDNSSFVMKDSLRKYGDVIYQAYINIYPLATYSWNDIATGVAPSTIRLSDGYTMPDNTQIPCIKDVTVVYVQDTWKAGAENVVGKYYQFIGTTGNENFNLIDPQDPSSKFKQINNYRHLDVTPSNSSIYWKVVETINSKKHLDDTIYSQTELGTVGTITNTYTIDTMIDTILFFNVKLEEIAVTVKDTLDNILVPRYTLDLRDYQGIMTPYSWFFTPVEGTFKENAFTKITPYSSIKVTIEYTNNSVPPRIGETIFTRMVDMGVTANAPQGRKRKFDTITIDDAGTKTKVTRDALIDEITYTVYIATERNDSVITQISKIINENIVIIGDESGKYANAIHYGWISEHPYELDTSSTQNKYSMKITTLA
jgi:hypothetical protein